MLASARANADAPHGHTPLPGGRPRRHRTTTPFAIRCWRLLRLSWHLVKGLWVAWLVYPRLNERHQRAAMRKWSRRLLAILAIRVRSSAPAALPHRCMLVSNHVSWVDIFVLASRYPAIFVAKSEIRRWPLVGTLCSRAGTVFIERGRRSAAKRTNAILSAAIARGTLVSLFPEGTTTDGRSVATFHAALLQPAIDAGAQIQPAVIRYLDAHEGYCASPNFVGETSFLESLWNITAERLVLAELQLLGAVPTLGYDRRSLASAVRAVILNAMIRQTGMGPEKRDGPPASSR